MCSKFLFTTTRFSPLQTAGSGVAIILASVAAAADANLPSPSIQVPDGFTITRVATPPLVSYPMFGGFDDQGRLFLAENAGVNLSDVDLSKQLPSHVRMVEDTDDDGIFDRSSIFADKFTFPQGIQWVGDSLYVASAPSVWRLRDCDGDGRADERVEIATGFKFSGNAADVHGPFLHPNGRLYWCHVRKGHEVYQKDGTLVSKGMGSRIWSCRPDGTDIQVHAGSAADNPTEIAFDQEGNIFGLTFFTEAPARMRSCTGSMAASIPGRKTNRSSPSTNARAICSRR